MAATVTDNRTIIDEADATTNWTGSVTISLVTSDPTPIESTGCLGQRNNNTTTDMYRGSLTAINFLAGQTPGPSLIYVWVFPRTVPDTKANGGIAIQLGDGTNRIAYHVGGIDESGFRHELGPTLWQCFVLDTAKADAGGNYSVTVKAGSESSLNFGAITQVGIHFKATVGAQGNVPNTYVDIMRYAPIGVGLTITGTNGVMTDIVSADDNIGNQEAFGIIRQLATGVYGLQGVLKIGDASGSANTSFSITNETIVFPGFVIDTNKYQIILQQGGSGSTTVTISGSTIYCPIGIGAKFDADGSGTINLDVDRSTLFGFSQGVELKSGHTFNDSTISNSGAVVAPGTDIRGTSILSSTVAADASAIVYNSATDPDGKLDNTTFTKGTNAHHAIELGTSTPTTMTLRGITFSGFNAANAQNDSVLHIKRTSGTVTINTVDCSGTVSYKSDGATVVIVADPVTTSVNVKNSTGSNIQNARVFLKASSGGPFPFEVTVTISNSGTTATVTHTAHAIATNDKVVIKGASHSQNNGAFTITKIDDNSYSYTMGSAPGSNPTGTIKSTYVALAGLTDSNGNISMSRVFSADQPVTGWVRKSSAQPYYKESALGGSIDSATGYTANIILISDE